MSYPVRKTRKEFKLPDQMQKESHAYNQMDDSMTSEMTESDRLSTPTSTNLSKSVISDY